MGTDAGRGSQAGGCGVGVERTYMVWARSGGYGVVAVWMWCRYCSCGVRVMWMWLRCSGDVV